MCDCHKIYVEMKFNQAWKLKICQALQYILDEYIIDQVRTDVYPKTFLVKLFFLKGKR